MRTSPFVVSCEVRTAITLTGPTLIGAKRLTNVVLTLALSSMLFFFFTGEIVSSFSSVWDVLLVADILNAYPVPVRLPPFVSAALNLKCVHFVP